MEWSPGGGDRAKSESGFVGEVGEPVEASFSAEK